VAGMGELNRPGFDGGSMTWKEHWSHGIDLEAVSA
jgi:hypothetical protein